MKKLQFLTSIFLKTKPKILKPKPLKPNENIQDYYVKYYSKKFSKK